MDPVQFLIRCDRATLLRSAKGSITANVHVELGTLVFPDRGWSDFVIVILGWWLEASNRLVEGARTIELRYMDGPFAIRATASSPTSCILECLEKAREPKVLGSATVDPVQMIEETERVATDIVEACIARGWQSRDLDTLKQLLDRSTARWRRH